MTRLGALTATICAGMLLVAVSVRAQQAEVVYVEGVADIRESGGGEYPANFGDGLFTGDSVVTGRDGRVELEQSDASTIRIASDTVFTVREVGGGGDRRTAYATDVGSAFFRFRTLVSKEPQVVTPSSVAGVRGTAFAVYAGVDGSSLYVVEEGRVDVSAAGETVRLAAGEGVEVRIGDTPGEKFEVMRGSIDYSDWNAERLDAMLADPVSALSGVARRMDELIAEIEALVPDYEAGVRRLESEREKLAEIEEQSGKAARSDYYRENVFPLEVDTSNRYLNIRYYALSALSLRRYVMTGLYIRVATSASIEFTEIYRDTADSFESAVVPYLVDADF